MSSVFSLLEIDFFFVFFFWTTWAAVQYPADESAEETFAVVRLTAPSCADGEGWHADQNAAEQKLAMIKDYFTL